MFVPGVLLTCVFIEVFRFFKILLVLFSQAVDYTRNNFTLLKHTPYGLKISQYFRFFLAIFTIDC